MPIYITGNGTYDNNDRFRSRFLYEHLTALAGSGLPVTRYYHANFMDGFTWNEGEGARAGLVHVDYETQARAIKKSGRFYREIIENKGITDEMYQRYVEPEKYSYG